MNIAVGCDHAGFAVKTDVMETIKIHGHNPIDMGTDSDKPVDYPDFTGLVVRSILSGKAQRGIILCGSGIGACMAANKFRGIRAGTCHDAHSAELAVKHNNMNVLCLGARVIGPTPVKSTTAAFLNAGFTGEERHLRRIEKITAIEKEQMK